MPEDLNNLVVVDCCCVDDTIWFSSYEFNGIFKLDLSDRKIKYVGSFITDQFIGKKVLLVYEYNLKLYFFNMYTNIIGNYGIVSMDIKTLRQEQYWKFQNKHEKYPDVIQRNNKFICVPEKCDNPLVVFDLDKKSITTISDWISSKNVPDNIIGKFKLVDNHYYAAITHTNRVIELDPDTLKAKMLVLNCEGFEMNQLISDGDGFFATGFNSDKIIEWRNHQIKYIDLPMRNSDVSRGIVCCNKLYLFPSQVLENIVVYNIKEGIVYTLKLPRQIKILEFRKNTPLFGLIKVFDNKVIAPPWGADSFIIIDAETDAVLCISSKVSDEAVENCLINSMDLTDIIKESECNKLNFFLKRILDVNISEPLYEKRTGKKIHEKIKRSV